ncbi:pectate lyase superfamily protein-domain-containing protein [Mycena rebaudengoi]|nr:pectate lyase superfamily protein-domain-containing protein [Mycena rebaudengoi]
MWIKSVTVLSIFIQSARSLGCPVALSPSASPSDPFWMSNPGLHVLGKSAYNPGYKVYRNVKTTYGAVGDGIADDTAAINRAISDQPAIVYFPPGKYRVTKPIIPYYFTSLVGDFKNKPTLIADANFVGVAVIDANPYIDGASNPDGTGVNWWLKNFVIGVRVMSPDKFGTGIHWQVGQCVRGKWIGWFHVRPYLRRVISSHYTVGDGMTDGLRSGAFGLWISNQQFTIRNVKITNAGTAIYEQWNWGFTWQNIDISNCQVGFDLHTGGLTLDTQSAGGVLIVDSWITNVGIGIRMSSSQPTRLGGSVILDNVIFTSIFEANIRDQAGVLLPASTGTVGQWVQGNVYSDVADPLAGLTKSYKRGGNQPSGGRAHALVNAFGAYFSKPRPQYENYKDIQFQNLMAFGAAGDGTKDDTAAINAFLQRFSGCAILCDIQPSHSILGPLTFLTVIEAGTYLVTDTIFVPPGTIIVGQMFSVIMGSGPKFANQNTPTPVLRVGNPGDTGAVEISDLVITTTGGSAGAIGIEWNVKASSQGAAGMWDVHVRLRGTKGTNINAANCPTSSTNAAKCASAFLGFHITRSGSGYFENVWVWNADHDLDDPAESKLNVFSGRGVLVESTGPVWLVGTASEHHVIYQYAFNKARDIWAGLIQTETPYFQPTPKPPAPFSINPLYGDPAGPLTDAWGLVITLSSNIFVYGAGFYSFFQTPRPNPMHPDIFSDSMVLIDPQSASIYLYQVTTAGSTNMISYPNVSIAKQADNINGFASTLTFWEAPQQVPQGSCGVAARAIEASFSGDEYLALRELLARQSEDYNYYSFIPNRINTELMVGAMDGNGNRLPRQNCVFYVNQQGVDPEDPNYARTRAIQFAALMNAANPGGDYHTLCEFCRNFCGWLLTARSGEDDVYDNARAFTDTEDPMRSANTGGNRRNWFRLTSAQYARLCTGRLYLIVEEQPREIWHDSIWVTHEYPAVVETGAVTQIIEIRPSEVGRALQQNSIRYIPHYPYRGNQPPGATPPRDGDKSEIDECAQIDPAKEASKWAKVPEVSGDVPPFKEGTCTMHVKQYNNNESGGGGPFDDPNISYSFEVTLFDNGAAHKIGVLPRTNSPVDMTSKLDTLFTVTAEPNSDFIQFKLGSVEFRSDDGSCSVGGWDHGRDRQMDCGFPCVWNGGDSTDHTPPELFYA